MIPVAVAIGLVVIILVAIRFEREDRPFLIGSFFAHLAACFAFLWFSGAWDRIKRGDIDGYSVSASGIARLVFDDPWRWAPELVKLIAHEESELLRLGMSPVPTTAAAHGWSGVAQILSGGDESLTAGCLVVAIFSFLAKTLLFAVGKAACGAEQRGVVAVGTLFVPSFLFWSCGFVKEAFAIIGMGLTVYGVHHAFALRRYYLLPCAAFGIAMIASIKPYILFPLVLGCAAWLFASRRGGKTRFGYVLAAIGIAYAGIALMGQIFPEFGVDTLNKSIAASRHASSMAGGGSLVGDEGADDEQAEHSFLGNLAALPIGLVNVLLRPFLFEVRGIPQLGAALENTIVLITVILLVRRYSMRKLVQEVLRAPAIFASVVFALTFAAAVGLSSKNLGTLSRYRLPMMPAYVMAVGVLRQRLRGGLDSRVSAGGAMVPRRAGPARGRRTRAATLHPHTR